MNTDAIDKLLEEIGITEQRYIHEIVDKLVRARGEIERLNALVKERLERTADGVPSVKEWR